MGTPSPAARSRLADEPSPYLRQHSDNAVDWYPWGEEAFKKAREENKPIFLSVGYSTCHWCHVMEEESFMNPQVGEVLNRHYVPIKVDRETRPDIDRLYMGFLVASTGSGGWPMSVFLTPNAEPFMAGTYYPQPARYGRIGFLDLITEIAQSWSTESESFKADAAGMARRMAEAAVIPKGSGLPGRELTDQALNYWRRIFDKSHGGFAGAPKFPQASVLSFLLMHGRLYPKAGSEKMALQTLKAMASGGIRDQLEGGFHRYSTDQAWKVPHFEKMLSDQAQLLALYSRAYALTGEQVFAETARSTADYVLTRLALDQGLASAEDADSTSAEDPSKHGEGLYYVWTAAELKKLLPPAQWNLVEKAYGITAQGNAGEELAGKNVLAVADPNLARDRTLPEALQTLREARAQRPRPLRDDKVLTAWNAMTAGALAEASVALREPRYLVRALAILDVLENHLTVDGQLRRSWFEGKADTVPAFAQDHAEMVAAYLAVHRASGQAGSLLRAVHWQERQDRLFGDAANGGYFETPAEHGLLFRDKELQDGANPSTASRTAQNLVQLYRLTGQSGYRQTYEALLQSLGPRLAEAPQSLPGVLQALALMDAGEQSAVLVGDREAWWELLGQGYHPQRTALWLRDAESRQTLASLVPFLSTLPELPAVYFCQNFTCGPPITKEAELKRRLRESGAGK